MFFISHSQCLQMCDAYQCGRMRVVECRVQRIGCQCLGVVLIQLDQRGDQVVGSGLLRGVGIRLKFVLARIGRAEGLQQES